MEAVEVVKSMFGGLVVKYSCPHCRERLKSPLTDAGKTDSCANCRRQFVVPGKTDLQRERLRQEEETKQKQAALAVAERTAKLDKARKLQALKAKEDSRREELAQLHAQREEHLEQKKANGEESNRLLIGGLALIGCLIVGATVI